MPSNGKKRTFNVPSFNESFRKRFGVKELAETAQARFQQATQASGESLEDWADRILTLAT